jgi:uncharacterized membrane protein (DUF485 family)
VNFSLPSLLLVLVVITHYSYALIAGFYPDMLASAKAWASVLRAIEATLLYFVVWALVPPKPSIVRRAASVACAWGILESVEIGACRLAFPMDRPPPDTGPFQGLCDKVTGWPVYMTTIMVVLFIAVLRKP